MAELIYRNVKNLPAVESKDDMNESDAIIVVQDETTKQASFADVRDAIIDLIDYSDVGADPVGSADDALATAKAYTDQEISTLNASLSEDIANNTTAIQDLTTYADDTFETKTEATQSHTDILNTVTNTYATKTENAKTLTDAKAYTDREIGALNTSVASTYATKVENNQTLSDAKAYTDTEINKLDAALSKDIADNASAIQTLSDNTDASIEALTKNVTDNYATKVENAQTLTDAKSYTDDEISSLDAKLTESISANASGIQTLATDVATNYATKVENAQTLTDAKSYTDSEISTLNISLSADIADNTSDIQALAKNVTDNYATKVENNQSLTDAKTYTDEEISTLNTSLSADITALSTNVTTNYATKVENAQSLTDAKAYTDSEISSLDTSLSADIQDLSTNVATNYATKTENAKSLTDAKAYTDSEISTLNTSLSADISSNATAIQKLSTNVTNNYVKKTDTIGKATADASGNVITTTYATKTENAQSLTDAKAYTDDEISKLIGTAPDTLDTLGEISEALKNNAGIVDSIIAQIPTKVSQLTNDSAYITKNSDITGTAAKAIADGAGQQINSTYIKGLSTSGTTLRITKGDGTTSTISTQDKNVTNTLSTTKKAYVTGTTSDKTNTSTQVFNTGVYLDTTAGKLVANTFAGALSGNASTASKLATARTIALTGSVTGSGSFDGSGNLSIATSFAGDLPGNASTATKATQDSAGQQITTTYIKDLKASGTTLTITKGDGSTSTITTQDTNTDTKVTQTVTTTSASYPVLLAPSGQTATTTTTSYFGTGLTFNPSTKTLTTTTFSGALAGNASTATKLATARTIALTGSVTGSGTFDGSGNLSIATTTNHTHSYLPLSGGTLTGDVVLPITKSSVDASLPVAGATMGITDITSLRNYKTYLGSYTHSGTWYNLISTRHRNGSGDGNNYGMYLRSTLTSSGDLTWGKQYGASSWQAERTILDSSNYTSYTVTKTGTGASGSWGISITGSSASCTGNASTATKATQDSAGQQINTTYIKGLSVSGTKLTITKGDGSTSTITTQDTNTDTKVTNTLATTTKAYLTGTTSATTNTGTQVFDTGVYLDTTAGSLVAGTVTATTFKGALSGNASTASRIVSGGTHAETASGTDANAPTAGMFFSSGLFMTCTYNDAATPVPYGNIINLAGGGTGQLLCEWSGADNTLGHLYYRSHRDTSTGGWSSWGKVAFTTDTVSAATKATQDSAGQQINTTYIKGLSVSGTKLTITKGDGSTSTITTQDTNTDTKVTNTLATTTKAYITGTTSATTNTGTQVFDTGVYLDTTAGMLTATAFKGALSGNASTATKLATARTIALTGSVTGSGTFDGSGNLSIATTTNHTHSYLPLAGGDMTGTISTSKTTGTILAGNQGEAIINSTADAGVYTMLAKMNSTNGYFIMGTYQNKYLLQYTAKSTVDAGTNSVTYSATLLDESGNTTFPGTIFAAAFNGLLYTNGANTSFVNNQFTAGEALAANDLIILDASTGKWFKSTTARTYVGVAMVATARVTYASGATVFANVGMQRTVTAATVGSLAAHNLVLIQGTLGDDGVSFTTDGTITNTRIEGKEYIRAGYLQASTSIILSGTNPQILTWGSGGTIDTDSVVTIDTTQTVSGSKTFSGTNYVTGKMQQSGAFTDYTTYRFRNTAMGTSSTPTTDATYGGSGSIYIQYS